MPSTTKIAAATTEVQRRKVAQAILKLRKAGTPWDGPNGIVAQGFVSGAPQGRALLRKFNLADTGKGIAKSYDRDAYGLKGPRKAAPAPAKKGRTTGKAGAKKVAPRKAAPKRAAK